jgi:hypothetical protein
MSFYTLALFAHILGVLGLFIGIGLQWTSVLRFRRAQFVAQVREWTSLTSLLGILMPAASLLILVAGSYMTVTTWGWRTPWIDVSAVDPGTDQWPNPCRRGLSDDHQAGSRGIADHAGRGACPRRGVRARGSERAVCARLRMTIAHQSVASRSREQCRGIVAIETSSF